MAPPVGIKRALQIGILIWITLQTLSISEVDGKNKRNSNKNKTDYHVAAILPTLKQSPIRWKFAKEFVAPALDLALERIHRRPGISRQLKLIVSYADSKCDAAESLNNAIEFYTRKQV